MRQLVAYSLAGLIFLYIGWFSFFVDGNKTAGLFWGCGGLGVLLKGVEIFRKNKIKGN